MGIAAVLSPRAPSHAARLWGAVQRIEEELGLELSADYRSTYAAALAGAPRDEVEAGRLLGRAEAVTLARTAAGQAAARAPNLSRR